MTYRNGNYVAFYVSEEGGESNLKAHAVKDFVYYNSLRMWKGKDNAFPFIDAHNKNYNVRDGSDWESTLKPRLRERLRASKNIILFLSERTCNSKALREEIDYGINTLDLPVIVIYPDFSDLEDILNNESLKKQIKVLWELLPILKTSIHNIPSLHIPMNKLLIERALKNRDFMIGTQKTPGIYIYKS